MPLLAIIQRYQSAFFDQYAHRVTGEQRRALQAILDCRTARYGEMRLHCKACHHQQSAFHSCGHRNCPQCQHHDTTRWLERQGQKLLPVSYFMVTFTLPFELRAFARQHPKPLYGLLFHQAASTLKSFSINDKQLGAELGMTAVLHTHSRRLDYHPHLHVVVPAGCLDKQRQQWKSRRGRYLFNAFNLAKVFRARFLQALLKKGFLLPDNIPQQWVVNCQFVGQGLPALNYLARYLYRGVIQEKNILQDDGKQVTFRYLDSQSRQLKTRTLDGQDFIWLVIQHVLPKGFRRVRDFGFLHGNAKPSLRLIQWALGIIGIPHPTPQRAAFICHRCHQPMAIISFVAPAWRSG